MTSRMVQLQHTGDDHTDAMMFNLQENDNSFWAARKWQVANEWFGRN